jgi:ABC-type multidrug transport system permease subunit
MIARPPGRSRLVKTTKEALMVLWILLGALYLTLFFLLGLATLRKGHYFLFFVGIIFPLLWVVGALLGPTQSAQAAGVR